MMYSLSHVRTVYFLSRSGQRTLPQNRPLYFGEDDINLYNESMWIDGEGDAPRLLNYVRGPSNRNRYGVVGLEGMRRCSRPFPFNYRSNEVR